MTRIARNRLLVLATIRIAEFAELVGMHRSVKINESRSLERLPSAEIISGLTRANVRGIYYRWWYNVSGCL
jgi:hypothetical protein